LAAKLPRIRSLYEQKVQERNVLNQQIEFLWRLIVSAANVDRAGGKNHSDRKILPPEDKPRRRAAPAQDRAIRALKAVWESTGFAVGPTSLYKFMVEKGMDAPKDANVLGANLWDAWKAGRIKRAPNGVYTPLDGTGTTDWDRPLTDYYQAAELGFPVP
jgi:hypothetical protein